MQKKNSIVSSNAKALAAFHNSNISPQKKNPETKPQFNRMKSSFFGPANPRRSTGFFGTTTKSNNTWIDDRPEGEKLGEFYEIRKKIIFKKINIIRNENDFAKLIYDSQSKVNNAIKQEGLFCTPREVYDWTLILKENLANYCLILYSYLKAKKNITAHHLFLLMDIQNRDKVEKIYQQIKKNFKNMSNSNRIGKFYPSIIRIFIQILGVLIKLANRFNKLSIENFYLKKYLLTINIVKNTVIERFIAFNTGVEGDFKNLGRFFFFDCLFKVAIYFFFRYQSFEIIFGILNNIIEVYKNFSDSFMINSEHILLLKTYYNQGLLLYTQGNVTDALNKFNESNSYIRNIYHFPYIVTSEIPKEKISKELSNSSNIKSVQDKSTLSSFNIDESVDKIMANKLYKKRSSSTKVEYDTSFKSKEILYGLKQKFLSVINFGKNKIIFFENEKKVESFIREQIYIEIALIMAEIELNRNNYERAFSHINYILNLFDAPINNNNNKLNYSRTFKEVDRNSLDLSHRNKNAKNKINKILELTDLNRRRICFILDKIEVELGIIQNKNKNIFKSRRKSLEEIEDISSYDSNTSQEQYSEYDNYQYENKNIFEPNKEKKIIRTTEKFFIFICSLSLYQLKVLNKYQPEESQKRDELPLIFPSQFKDVLTFRQRLALDYLDTMSLSRCVILLDPKKDISPENLNYYLISSKKNILKKNYLRKNKSVMWIRGNPCDGYLSKFMKKIENNNSIQDKKENSSINNSANISMNLNLNRNKNIFGINYLNNYNNKEKKNLKKKLFIQGKFQKFMEENESFNNKIDEIIINDDKIKINRSKIYKVMNQLNPDEKELLMEDKSYVENFVKDVKKKLKRSRSSFK